PAFATAMSTRPSSSTQRATRASTCSLDETSTSTTSARRPVSSTASRTGCTSCGSPGNQPRTTSAPAVAKTWAVAAPIPEAAPVTTATRFSRLNIGRSLEHHIAAVRAERLPDVVRRLFGGEEHRGRCDLVYLAETADRELVEEELAECARVVHEDIDRAELRVGSVDQGAHLLLVGDVRPHE